ncbi:MAG: ABC-2 type transport system ATP-binding protein [Cellvibrionaceae bacterium]|jgi:ABC-2 type transport system ATP-binding protein
MIEAIDLVKRYEDFEAVKGISFSVKEGELMALLGPNGAGKTSTIRMISSILAPTSGQILVNGQDTVKEADDVRRSIGMITEQPGLYERMTGMEYLMFYGRLYGLQDKAILERGERLYKRFGMEEAIDRRLGGFSKGMKQKVGLIRAMLHNPPVLLLDEPTSAMDPRSSRQVRDAIQELGQDNRAIILTTHNLNEAEQLADRIAIINDGVIVAQGTADELRRQLSGDRLMKVTCDKPLQFTLEEIATHFPEVKVESIEDCVIRYRSNNPVLHNPQMIRFLAGHGVGTVMLSEITPSLEEIYLSIVKEDPTE